MVDRDLLERAGLDAAAFAPATPDFATPGVASDERSAWVGAYPGAPDFPIRVEIARSHGRVVSFEILREASRVSGLGGEQAMSLAQAAYAAIFVLVVVGGLTLAWRQWRAGRGDVRGARRLAAAVFSLAMVRWLLATHHVPSVQGELESFQQALGVGAQHALIAFALYLAGEPILRRNAPGLLAAWTRLLAGRARDPSVGRDVLIGMAFASLYKLSELVFKTDWSDPLRLGCGLACIPTAQSMASVSFAVGVTATDVVDGIVNGCLTLLGAIVVIRACRVRAVGIVVATCLLALAARAQFGAGGALAVHLAALSFAILAMVVALRFGLLALVVSFAVALVLNGMPTTVDPRVWWFPSFAAQALLLVGIAVVAYRRTLGPAARGSSAPA